VSALKLRKGVVVALLALATTDVAIPAGPAAARPDAGGAGPEAAYTRPGATMAAAPVLRRPSVAVSVMSFNVCGGVCRGGEVRRTAAFTANTAVRQRASVVLLQELCYSQYVRIRELLAPHGYTGRFAAGAAAGRCDDHDRRHGRGFGVAVLARGKTSGTVVRRLPTAPGAEGRVMLGTTATVGGRRTFVAVVHLSPSPRAGLARQLRSVAAYLAPRAGRPVIVGGDFNALPTYPGLSRFYATAAGGTGRFVELDERRGGTSARSGAPTFDVAGRKIDYVFVSEGLFAEPRATSIGTGMSDHRVYIGTARVNQP
jgi:endonuclease/exonuclease/phosphatase family metal-dependent hydrolase